MTHGHPEPTGFLRKYVFSVDHKVIGKQYLFTGLVMALVGGYLAYVMRAQLAWPGESVPGFGMVQPDTYNALITMHGTIMVFWVAMPILIGAFGNFLLPLMVGADDMAFPRLNMMSYWTFLVSTLVLIGSFFVPGGAASAGWTVYPPLSADMAYTGVSWGMKLWILAVALEFASILMGGVNYLTTVLNMRAPGLSLMRLPLFVWMQLIAALVFMFSVGPLIAGALMLLLDLTIGAGFFLPESGGDPLLWQHLFWFFGHPEVYVILLPALGIVAEALCVFSRKPIFGYRIIVYSTLVAGVLSMLVWAHHQYVSGIDPRLAFPFSLMTILISVPFAVIIFAFIATLWRGSIQLNTAMLFAVGLLALFLIGGTTGILLGPAATDIYFHDTYYVVAHFHYTLFPTVFFGMFVGVYMWFPKMFGRMMNEVLGQIHFWLTAISFNFIFIPMFFAGVAGHHRRIADPTFIPYIRELTGLHVTATWATVILLLSQVPFIVNVFWSMYRGKVADRNPWKANTLEWVAPSPPPHGNFETPPSVHRGPYEYSVPGRDEDWLPQNAPPDGDDAPADVPAAA